MTDAGIIAGAIKAYFEFLCTPAGQEFAKAGNTAIWNPLAALVASAFPPQVQGK